MSNSENTKIVGIHPTNDKVNTNITIFICIIYIGYILKNIYEYSTYFNKNRFLLIFDSDIREKALNIFSNICSLVSLVAFFLLFTLTLLLFLYIIKDSYNLNNLNKNLIIIGFPIILGIYFLNTILFTMNYSNIEKITKSNIGHGPFKNEVFKNKAVISRKIYQLTPNPLYILNPFNLTLLISIIYMIYWDNWGSPSWEKWSIYISSVIVFNLLLGLIYFFQTRTKKDKIFARNIKTFNNRTRQSLYAQNYQNKQNFDLGTAGNQYYKQIQNNLPNNQRTSSGRKSLEIG